MAQSHNKQKRRGELLLFGCYCSRPVNNKGIRGYIKGNEGMTGWQLLPPRGRGAAKGNKVSKQAPKGFACRAGSSGQNRRRLGGGGWGCAEGIHAPPAMVHRFYRCQAHHLPHTAV